MAGYIRENPLHQPAQKPIGTNTLLPQINHVAGQGSGAMFAHLGHFANPGVLAAGHNTDPGGPSMEYGDPAYCKPYVGGECPHDDDDDY